MGYLVPGTKQAIHDALNSDLREVLSKHELNSEKMEELIRAYHASPVIFDRNKENLYQSLYETFQTLGIGKGTAKDDLFPPDNRSFDHFKNTFHKLWKTVSIYAELNYSDPFASILMEDEHVALPNTSSVAEIYEHYDNRYDRILMEQDIVGELDYRMGLDLSHEQLADSLKKLNTYSIFHKTDEPFSDDELNKINIQTARLNKPFLPAKQKKVQGFVGFDGESVKTPADLKNYLDRYETVLREFINKDSYDFREFAQSYKGAKDAGFIKELTEADLHAAKHKKAADALDADFEALLSDFEKLEWKNRKKDKISVCEQYQSYFEYICSYITDEILRDQNVKDMEKKLAKVYKEGRADPESYESLYADIYLKTSDDDGKIINGERRQLNDLCEKYQKELSDAHNISHNVKEYENSVNNSIVQFKKALRDYRKETADGQFKKEFSDCKKQIDTTLKEIKAERKQLQANFDEEKQRLLDEKSIRFTEFLKDKLQTFNQYQSDAKQKLDVAYTDCKNQIEKAYRDEQNDWLSRINQSIEKIADLREKFKEDYQNSSYVKRKISERERNTQNNTDPEAKKRAEISDELGDICDALNSKKKKNLFGKEKKSSSQYTTMMDAIDSYRMGLINSNTAYEACKAYLSLSLNADGSLDDMGSKLGKLRKQACVRMMELLKPDPDPVAAEQIGDENRERINYETLKVSLARKSKDCDANNNDLNAKAYSNLNDKIKKAKAQNNMVK